MGEYPKVSEKFSNRVSGSSWKSKLKMFIITAITVFISISFFWGEFGFFRMWYLSKTIDRIEKDIRVLKVQRNDLLWETDKMQNDPQYIQRFAIETYGYARADQKIIQFVPADSTAGHSRGVAQINGRSTNEPIQNRSVRRPH
jgi:cell division protein FtsB